MEKLLWAFIWSLMILMAALLTLILVGGIYAGALPLLILAIPMGFWAIIALTFYETRE